MSPLAIVTLIVAAYCVIIVLFTLGLGRLFRYTEVKHEEMMRNHDRAA
ncbi:hypothetical protein [Glutamicibacter ardleyensis]|uniref:Uncharacterized protein n=1 Tax=Glutamicibacter ardleyensis TaxID=225894 RepID=A0ABQ2DVG3_9MICC|nr:hypothetical protein [Glutamicibacter ardleyensis]GGJ74478.1 hypothetical protein GCM10007173_36820 [Glutamicibacter ardleyensis]